MIAIFIFPEIFDPEDCLQPSRLKANGAQASDPLPRSPGDAFVANAGSAKDIEILSRVLQKDPDLRAALYKALDEEGAFTFFPTKSSK